MFKRLMGVGGMRKSESAEDLRRRQQAVSEYEAKDGSAQRTDRSNWNPWGGTRPEEGDDSIEIRCKTLSRVDVRQEVHDAMQQAGYDTSMDDVSGDGEDDDDDNASDPDLLSLTTLPKITERLNYNDTSLPSVIANIKNHQEKQKNRDPHGNVDDEECISPRQLLRMKATRESGSSGSQGSQGSAGRIDVHDRNDPTNSAVTPSAVVELFTHQADREAFVAERMLQDVCDPERRLQALDEGDGERPSPSSVTAEIAAPRPMPLHTSDDDATHRNAIDLRKAGYKDGRGHHHRILKLVYHVNVWDSGQWKDAFASETNTQRQKGYARKMKIKHLYLPQVVVNGSVSFAASSDETQTVDVLQHTLESSPLETKRAHIWMQFAEDQASQGDGGGVRRIKAIISAGSSGDGGDGGLRVPRIDEPDIVLVVYDSSLGTVVGKGAHKTKRGQAITETNVVRKLTRIRTWNGKPMEVEFGLPCEHDGACLLLQEAGEGQFLFLFPNKSLRCIIIDPTLLPRTPYGTPLIGHNAGSCARG